MRDMTSMRLERLKKRVEAKNYDQLIYAMCRLIYDFKMFDELKERLK